MTLSPSSWSILTPPDASELLTVSEQTRARWRELIDSDYSRSDEDMLNACKEWVAEPAFQSDRFLLTRRLLGRPGLKIGALKAVIGPWRSETPGVSLHPFYRAQIAVEFLAIIFANNSPPLTSASASEALLTLLRGVSPEELNAPWPQLQGSSLLDSLFGPLKNLARWALKPLSELGFDASGRQSGPLTLNRLIEEACDTSASAEKTMAPWIQAGASWLDRRDNETPPLCLALEKSLEGRLSWSWPEAIAQAGADFNAASGLGVAAAHLAFQTDANEDNRAKGAALLRAAPSLDWSAESIWGSPAHHGARYIEAGGAEWWHEFRDEAALWQTPSAFIAFDRAAEWDPERLDPLGNLIDFMDRRFSATLAVLALGAENENKTPPSLFETVFSAWVNGLPAERLALFKTTAESRAPNAKNALERQKEAEANKTDPRPTFELYTEASWSAFKSEYLGPGEHAFATALSKRVRSKGESHRIRRLALASGLMAKLDELRADFPHFAEVVEHLEDHCHLQLAGDGSFFIPPMLLAGAPGVGKTFFFKRVADHVSTAYRVLQMESMTGSFVITGMASSWSDSRPGAVYSALELGDTGNPIILLDEIDKSSKDSKHRPDNALLPLLEPHSAQRFQDECTPLEMDARRVCWVATANEISSVSAPLQSRMDVFRVRAPNARERRALCSGVYRAVLGSGSWGSKMSPTLSEAVLDMAAQTQGAGATRDLRRALTTACAKALRAGRTEIVPSDLPCAARPAPTLWDAALPETSPAKAA